MSIRFRGAMLLSASSLMLLGAMLSACSGPIVLSTPALDCDAMIPATLKAATPSATGPEDSSKRAWIGFGIRQTGQLEKANLDKQTVLEITAECHRQQRKVVEDARQRTTPWYRRIL